MHPAIAKVLSDDPCIIDGCEGDYRHDGRHYQTYDVNGRLELRGVGVVHYVSDVSDYAVSSHLWRKRT